MITLEILQERLRLCEEPGAVVTSGAILDLVDSESKELLTGFAEAGGFAALTAAPDRQATLELFIDFAAILVNSYDESLGIMPALVYYLTERDRYAVDIEWSPTHRMRDFLLWVGQLINTAEGSSAVLAQLFTLLEVVLGGYPPHRVTPNMWEALLTILPALLGAARGYLAEPGRTEPEIVSVAGMLYAVAAFGIGLPQSHVLRDCLSVQHTASLIVPPGTRCPCDRCDALRVAKKNFRHRDENNVPANAPLARQLFPCLNAEPNFLDILHQLLQLAAEARPHLDEVVMHVYGICRLFELSGLAVNGFSGAPQLDAFFKSTFLPQNESKGADDGGTYHEEMPSDDSDDYRVASQQHDVCVHHGIAHKIVTLVHDDKPESHTQTDSCMLTSRSHPDVDSLKDGTSAGSTCSESGCCVHFPAVVELGGFPVGFGLWLEAQYSPEIRVLPLLLDYCRKIATAPAGLPAHRFWASFVPLLRAGYKQSLVQRGDGTCADDYVCAWSSSESAVVGRALERLTEVLEHAAQMPDKPSDENVEWATMCLLTCYGIVCGLEEFAQVPELRRFVVQPAGGACGLVTAEVTRLAAAPHRCLLASVIARLALRRAQQASTLAA